MNTWKTALLVNGACLVGIIISLFVVPLKTPLWLWGTVSALVFVLVNYAFLGRKHRVAASKGRIGWMTAIVIVLGLLVLLADLIFRNLHR